MAQDLARDEEQVQELGLVLEREERRRIWRRLGQHQHLTTTEISAERRLLPLEEF